VVDNTREWQELYGDVVKDEDDKEIADTNDDDTHEWL